MTASKSNWTTDRLGLGVC